VRLEVRTIDTWPWPLTPARQRQRSRFDSPYSATTDLLERELRHLGARQAYICMAVPEGMIRRDRTGPLASARPDHPGVMVVTDSKHGDLRYATDVFTDWRDNLRAIALGLEALRKVDRYGITRGGEQYRGFASLPAPTSSIEATHMTRSKALAVLYRAAGRNEAELDVGPRLFKLARAKAHPDRHDGDTALWDQVEAAVTILDR
jgi:hypothetical protein